MRSARAIQDPVRRAAAIAEARTQLAQAGNKPLAPSVIARVDQLLGLSPLPPHERPR